MADEAVHQPGPFDVQTIRHLVQLMSRHELNEILLEQGESRIRLRRGHGDPVAVAVPAPALPAAAHAQPAFGPVPAPATPPPSKVLHEIKSPMVGTFYRSEKPEAEPYVKPGSQVTPTTVVGLIEAMKLFNEIQAECNGVIVEVCVDNAQPVDFNTVLFRVDPAG